VIYFILLKFLAPSLNDHFSWSLTQEYGYYSKTPSFSTDFEAARWIKWNIPSQDVILNDLSYASLFLPSVSFQNVVFSRLSELSRAIECKEIWMRPAKFQLLSQLIEKYEIKYIFSTLEWGYFDWNAWGGDDSYKAKVCTPKRYTQIFDECPFLRIRFAKDATRVYEVIL